MTEQQEVEPVEEELAQAARHYKEEVKAEENPYTESDLWDAEFAWLIENGWLAYAVGTMDIPKEVPHVECSTLLEATEPDSEASVGGDSVEGGQVVEEERKEVEAEGDRLHPGTDIPQERGDSGSEGGVLPA